jgi:hypothetical protein
MSYPGRVVAAAALLVIGIGVQAQQAPEVAVEAERIVGDPQMVAQERLERSITLVESRASIERSRGVPDVAEKLQRVAELLRMAPRTGEAARLAAEAAVAAEGGAIVDALVLAESAAVLSPDWQPGD